jgi:hypothetical protein
MGKDHAERKRADRQRLREAGYVLKQIWVRPKDWPRVKRFLGRLRSRE